MNENELPTQETEPVVDEFTGTERIPYEAPELVEYGDVATLTQGGGGTDVDAFGWVAATLVKP